MCDLANGGTGSGQEKLCKIGDNFNFGDIAYMGGYIYGFAGRDQWFKFLYGMNGTDGTNLCVEFDTVDEPARLSNETNLQLAEGPEGILYLHATGSGTWFEILPNGTSSFGLYDIRDVKDVARQEESEKVLELTEASGK